MTYELVVDASGGMAVEPIVTNQDGWFSYVVLPTPRTPNVGDRVRTLVAKDERMIGINVRAGVTGTIVRIEPFNGMCILGIKLDEHHADLDEWNNVLEFYLEGESEALDDYVIAL
jgi:hypothetical protein